MNQSESLPNWEMVFDCLKDMHTFSTNQIPHVAEEAIMEEDATFEVTLSPAFAGFLFEPQSNHTYVSLGVASTSI